MNNSPRRACLLLCDIMAWQLRAQHAGQTDGRGRCSRGQSQNRCKRRGSGSGSDSDNHDCYTPRNATHEDDARHSRTCSPSSL
jgi:hypothetical protein